MWTIITALTVSVGIELLQFLTYRGMLDVDDLVSNVCGAAIGLLIRNILERHSHGGQAEKWMSGLLIAAEIVGCIMVAVPAARSNISTRISEQFWFSISSVAVDDTVIIDGECFLYDQTTPAYTILFDSIEANTVVNGQVFRAEASRIEHKAEVQVKFRGFPAMPTGIWIKPTASGVEVEYVAGEAPVIPDLPKTAVLKAWNTENDTLVYQDGERLLWLIGKEIDKNTEVIYHIHTGEPEKLPERRVQYGFDNRGFRVGTERIENELEGIDHYRVFEKEIPEEYNVTAVVVGFNTDGIVTWTDSFRPT